MTTQHRPKTAARRGPKGSSTHHAGVSRVHFERAESETASIADATMVARGEWPVVAAIQETLENLDGPLAHLSVAERRVLYHLMVGRTAADICSIVVVSMPTVRTHIRSILLRLGVNSQVAAVALAYRLTLEDHLPDSSANEVRDAG